MFTQRFSSSAVCGYSSLSIMFLSNVSAIRRSACGSIHVVDERREVQPGVAVEHQLVVDELVRDVGVHLVVGHAVPRHRAVLGKDVRTLLRASRRMLQCHWFPSFDRRLPLIPRPSQR